jgi:transketolase
MRNAFANELETIAAANDSLVLLSGDIGNRMFDGFKKKFPERFLNCGVAEANMVSAAAGMALSGLHPVVYTIAPFLTYRCFEQIRLDVCYQNLPVILVGVGGGLSYAGLNATHHALEDIAVMRSLPNMRILCPGDPVETKLALHEAVLKKAPVYLRLGKKGEPVVHKREPHMEIGRWNRVRSGGDVCFLSCGTILPVVLEASDVLAGQGVSAEVISCCSVKPMDNQMLEDIFSSFELVIAVEEHSRIGGFGSALAEWLCDQPFCIAQLVRMATDDRFFYKHGSQEHLRALSGLTAAQISEHVLQSLNVMNEKSSVQVIV